MSVHMKSAKPAKPAAARMSAGANRAQPDGDAASAIVLPRWRMRIVILALLGGFVGLLGRAVWLQIVQGPSLRGESASRVSRDIDVPAFRGRILDRNGAVLAVSTPAVSVFAFADKAELSSAQVTALSKEIEMPSGAINKKLQSADEGVVMIKRQVRADAGEHIARMKIPGIGVQREYKREYPGGEAFSQVLGIANIDDIGQEGMELAQNGWLAGKQGKRKVIVNRRGEVVEDVASVSPPQEGRDVTLSIDHRLQFIAYQAVSDAVHEAHAKAGSAVVLDVRTGEILALANYPSFDPNNRTTFSKERARNRALTDTFEPGSTMKPFTIATSLEKRLVHPDTVVATFGGVLKVGNRTIHDTSNYGDLTVADVLAKSSNVGTARLAQSLSNEVLHKSFAKAGFGIAPQTGFPGEQGGRLRNPSTWREIEKLTMSYGYGLSVNLVQLARAYTVFATDGERKAATLMRTGSTVAGEPVFEKKTVLAVRDMLEQAVESKQGTGQRARVAGYRVGGKTGTARKIVDGQYADGKYVGSFVGIAPISAPRVVVAVMIDEPDASPGKFYGGVVAAPAFSRITREALRLLDAPFDAPLVPDLPQPLPPAEALPKEEV